MGVYVEGTHRCVPHGVSYLGQSEKNVFLTPFKPIPSGDPLMPADVRRAKHIEYLMKDLANLGDGENAEEIAMESFH